MLSHKSSRRDFLKIAGTTTGGLLLGAPLLANKSGSEILRGTIPATGESIPVIGMGTYITFNVGSSQRLLEDRKAVFQTFLDHGGGMVDSSPMYGSAESAIGYCIKECSKTERFFSATKIWTSDTDEGKDQMRDSQRLWGIQSFDLQQVHNLVNWQEHLKTLRQLKDDGVIRYIGVTTSHGRRHRELETLLKTEPLDFVQLTYNILDRETENRLIPLARDNGIAVIANRPFQGGYLMQKFQRKPLPPWASEVGVSNWAEFFLKFIISLPGLTCAIPATSKVTHMKENMGALKGTLPSQTQRNEMIAYIEQL